MFLALLRHALAALARFSRWTPVGRRAKLVLDATTTDLPPGAIVFGVIKAYDGRALLLMLDHRISYEREGTPESSDVVTLIPASAVETPTLLLIRDIAVRMIDAPSFVDEQDATTLATARLTLLPDQPGVT